MGEEVGLFGSSFGVINKNDRRIFKYLGSDFSSCFKEIIF